MGGRIITYNEDVSCRIKSGLPDDFKAAIPTGKFLEELKAMDSEQLKVSIDNGQIIFTGKNERFAVAVEQEVYLQLSDVQKPETPWVDIPSDFGDAVSIVEGCTDKDESKVLAFVHLHPKWVEASDQENMFAQYRIKCGIRKSTLVKSRIMKPLAVLGMTQICESDKWVHFRNPAGLVYSCMKGNGEFPDTSKCFDVPNGREMSLPKGLSKAAANAGIFSQELKENNIIVKLKPGRSLVKGMGESGWYEKVLKVKYTGPPLAFYISPKLLATIADKNNECVISKDRLKVNGGRWAFLASLGDPNELEAKLQNIKKSVEEGSDDAESGEEE